MMLRVKFCRHCGSADINLLIHHVNSAQTPPLETLVYSCQHCLKQFTVTSIEIAAARHGGSGLDPGTLVLPDDLTDPPKSGG